MLFLCSGDVGNDKAFTPGQDGGENVFPLVSRAVSRVYAAPGARTGRNPVNRVDNRCRLVDRSTRRERRAYYR